LPDRENDEKPKKVVKAKTVLNDKKKENCNKDRPLDNKSKGGKSRRFAGKYC